MLMAKNPRIPFPSFALALSRLEADDNNESTNNGIQETNASNVEPPIDLMVSCDRQFLFYGCRIELSLWCVRKHLILAYHATRVLAGKWYVVLSVENHCPIH